MRTANFSFDLMVPNQASKDITYNEAMLKIDSFMNLGVIDFIETEPSSINVGQKYIMNNGQKAGMICFRADQSKPVSYLPPAAGMVVFVQAKGQFFCYDGSSWQACSHVSDNPLPAQTIERRPIAKPQKQQDHSFVGIYNQHNLDTSKEIHYLYICENAEIIAKELTHNPVNIIVKQADSQVNKLDWSYNILWSNGKKPNNSPPKNSMSFYQLYKLPETDHYLGIIVGENFNY